MRHWLAPLALTLGVLLAGGMWLRGQAAATPTNGTKDKEKEKRTLTTTGTATIRIKPDAARLYLSVKTSAPTVKDTRAECAGRFTKVKNALLALKIPELKMKTSDISVEPEYSQATPLAAAKLTGYACTYQFTVLVTDTDVAKLNDAAGRLLDTALEQGVNVVSRVTFFRQDDTAARREAMTKAVESGVANAKALLAGIKVESFDTVVINDAPRFTGYDNRLTNAWAQQAIPRAGGFGEDDTQIVAGDLVISCQVNISCTY
jgi:uncharacterized protein YggE